MNDKQKPITLGPGGRRLPSPVEPEYDEGASRWSVGARVTTKRFGKGTVKWRGRVKFAMGVWYAVELDEKLTAFNGAQMDVCGLQRVPKCKPSAGIFLRDDDIADVAVGDKQKWKNKRGGLEQTDLAKYDRSLQKAVRSLPAIDALIEDLMDRSARRLPVGRGRGGGKPHSFSAADRPRFGPWRGRA